MVKSSYSDLELRYARPLAAALIERSDFRQWVLSGTRYEHLARSARHDAGLQRARRNRPAMTNPYWFNYWCGKDKLCTCRVGTAVETDILLVFACAGDISLAVHIEVKRPGDTLGDGQAETYPRRAACWANDMTRPRQILPHTSFVTLLACGDNLIGNVELGYFDKVLLHDQIANKLPTYPELPH